MNQELINAIWQRLDLEAIATEIITQPEGNNTHEERLDFGNGEAVLEIDYHLEYEGRTRHYYDAPPEWTLTELSFYVTRYAAVWLDEEGNEYDITEALTLNEDELKDKIWELLSE